MDFRMLPPAGTEKTIHDFLDSTRLPATTSKSAPCKKRSVSSPMPTLSGLAAKESCCIKYYADGDSVFATGKPTALALCANKQEPSESTATPSSGGRTPPYNNEAPSTLPSTCGSSISAKKHDLKEEAVFNVVKDHSSYMLPPKEKASEHKRSPSKDLTREIEKKRDQKVPGTTLLRRDTLSRVPLADPRVNNAPKKPAPLSNIPEDKVPVQAPAPARPTVVTVELAAAAKIFLETYYNEILRGPTPRALRTHHLERQLFGARYLSDESKQRYLEAFYKAESNHLRETRVLKARSTRSLLHDKGGGASMLRTTMCASNFEMLKTLGKGSFGTVRLVREKALPYDDTIVARDKRRQVYAMKVIRKSEMIRSGQEGHMRAERDFLVSSEGSNW